MIVAVLGVGAVLAVLLCVIGQALAEIGTHLDGIDDHMRTMTQAMVDLEYSVRNRTQ